MDKASCSKKIVLSDLRKFSEYNHSKKKAKSRRKPREWDGDHSSDSDYIPDEDINKDESPVKTNQIICLTNDINDNDDYLAVCPFPGPSLEERIPQETTTVSTVCTTTKELVRFLGTPKTLFPSGSKDAENNQMVLMSSTLSMIQSEPEKWRNNFLETLKTNPDEVIDDHKLIYASSLKRQAEKEFLFWSLHHEGNSDISSVYSLLENLVESDPVWSGYSKAAVQKLIESGRTAAVRASKKIQKRAEKVQKDICDWENKMEEGLLKNLLIMKKFSMVQAEAQAQPKFLDERSQVGKRFMLETFTVPYFKVDDFDLCYLAEPEQFFQNYYKNSLIDTSKHKWTTRDLHSLRKFIKDVIVEVVFKKLTLRKNYLMNRITLERAEHIEQVQGNGTVCMDLVVSGGAGTMRNSRGQKKKRVENDQTTLYRNFTLNLDDNSIVKVDGRMTTHAQDVVNWFHEQEVLLGKWTYDFVMKEPKYFELINWHQVAKKVTSDIGKERNATDCFLAWTHEAHPSVNRQRWSVTEAKLLYEEVQMQLNEQNFIDWDLVVEKGGNGRTPYQCLFKYRNRVVKNQPMQWDEEKAKIVVDVLENEGAKWGKAVEALQDVRATKHQLQERWKKSSKSILRLGPFTRVEDALLLLTLERLKGFVVKQHTFSILISYLPWRHETIWRDRANHLFSNWVVPWTKEEDELLLLLAAEQGDKKNWQEIAGKFTSFKNRKGCLTRHKILKNKIGEGKKFKDLDEYHEGYSMFRKNIFQYKHLQEAVELLKRIMGQELCELPFPGLSSINTPEEWELRYMLLDYDRDITQKTIEHLETYITSRNEYWKDWMEKNKIIKTFDRRSFHRENPQSVASAVHMRFLKLKSKTEIGRNLTEFEEDVYKYYGRFCRTKAVDKDVERKYLPSAKKLMKMSEIKDIVEPSSDMDEELSSDEDIEPLPKKKRGRPQKKDSTNLSKVVKQKKVSKTKKKTTSKVAKLKSKVVKRAKIQKAAKKKKQKAAKKKQQKMPKKSERHDKKTVGRKKKENSTVQNDNNNGLRQSSRKRKAVVNFDAFQNAKKARF